MDIRFDGKRALVTGAGKGIGRAVAKKLVECGAETIALSRTQSDLDSLKSEVPSITTVLVDLQDWDKTREVVQNLGPVDLLVNNAGVAVMESFLESKKETLDMTLDINLKALFNVSQVVAKGMVERGHGGAIVNVSSAASKMALQDHASYCSSKGAVDSLTKVMALELGPYKIRAKCINPTVVLTDLARFVGWGDPVKAAPMIARIPMGKFLEMEDVVNAVVFLLSDKSAMINGVQLPIEGGLLSC